MLSRKCGRQKYSNENNAENKKHKYDDKYRFIAIREDLNAPDVSWAV